MPDLINIVSSGVRCEGLGWVKSREADGMCGADDCAGTGLKHRLGQQPAVEVARGEDVHN